MEVYGIASIRREIFLWNGTRIFTEVPSSQKLKKDLNNIIILQQKDVVEGGKFEGQSIELPEPRGGQSITVCGNPPDYILIFGGVTLEVLDETVSTVSKIRKSLNDLWVYHTGTRLWQRIFVNSPIAPEARE